MAIMLPLLTVLLGAGYVADAAALRNIRLEAREELKSIAEACPVRSFVNGSSTELFGLCHTDGNGGGFVGSHVDLTACTKITTESDGSSKLEWSESGNKDSMGSLVSCEFKLGDDEPEDRRWDEITCAYSPDNTTASTKNAELSLKSSPIKLNTADGRLACAGSGTFPGPRIGAVDQSCTYFWVYMKDDSELMLKAQCFNDAGLASDEQRDYELSLAQCLAWHQDEGRLVWKTSSEPNGLQQCDMKSATLADENRRFEVDCQHSNGETKKVSVRLVDNIFNMNGLDCMDESGKFLKSSFESTSGDL